MGNRCREEQRMINDVWDDAWRGQKGRGKGVRMKNGQKGSHGDYSRVDAQMLEKEWRIFSNRNAENDK